MDLDKLFTNKIIYKDIRKRQKYHTQNHIKTYVQAITDRKKDENADVINHINIISILIIYILTQWYDLQQLYNSFLYITNGEIYISNYS